MKLFYRLLILLVLCLSNIASAQLYTFKNFGHKDGLSIASITSFLQSDNGTLWLGTDGAGIIGFNGYAFKEFPSNSQNKDHHVTSIIQYKKGLVFTSLYKGLYSFNDGKYKLLSTIYDETGGFLRTFECNDKLYYITTKGVYRYNEGNDTKLMAFSKAGNELEITSVIPLQHGVIILSSSGNFYLSENNDRIGPLNNWLHTGKESVNFAKFGYQSGDKITLFNDRLTKELTIVLNDKGQIFKLDYNNRPEIIEPGEFITSLSGNSLGSVFLTSKNTLWKKQGNAYFQIAHNYLQQLEMCENILLDQNDDIWITSSLKGLYKVSLEPFAKIQLHPVYNSASICALHRSNKGDVLISTMEGETNIGQIYDANNSFKKYDFQTNTVAEYGNILFLGTNEGIKQVDLTTKAVTSLNFNDENKDKITLLFIHDDILYCGTAEKGLSAYDLKNKFERIKMTLDPLTYPYIYTAQVSNDNKKILFGTNNGIVTLDKQKLKFSKVPVPKSAGSFSGVSTKDVHGNLWFTCDHALIGILKNGELKILDDPKMFPSTLFYTLNSDNYGNLIVGSNKGINIINVSEYGEAISYKWYTGTSGFEGYETHMRSQFQDKNSIFVGTVEGLFLINTSILQNIAAPNAPVIELVNANSSTWQFRFLVHNPKIKSVEYSYRIKGFNDEWSELNSLNEISLLDLPNGEFVIEVKATYNGIQFSKIGSYKFNVEVPFWQSKWFTFLLLFVLVGINIFLINRNRSLATGKLFNTKDTSVTFKLTPTIILTALIADTSLHLFAPHIDPEVSNSFALTLIEGFILLFLYLSSLSAKRNHNTEQYKILLTSAFLIVLGHNFYDLYDSNLHPFFILAIVIINSITPFIFERISWVLIFSTLYILTGCIFVLSLENTIYNEFLFLLAMIVSVVLCIFGAFLRYDSMEKLIFISGVINKGDVPAIAFNSQGIMTYVSENIKNMISANHESLIGQHLSALNTFVPEEGNYRKVDLTQDFEDGQKYLVPMISKDGDLKWMEWSCKVFNEDVKVILGQNVTDRMELENTYELLIQNAEDLIYQCDINGNFSFLNNRCYEKLGYDENELIGKHSMTLVPEEYVEEVSNFYRQHFEKRRESSYFEFPIRQKNGAIIWVGQYVTTLYKPGEVKIVNGFLALARDITLMRHQQQVIKEQRDDITSSINYAQKIQLNLLPGREKFSRSFDETCIFYRPKDIVSGDFFWLERIDDLTIIALADCTGHGVPGSFMTLLGINLLNSIVLEQRIFNPGTILDELDKKLIAALPRANGEENMSDGMEITICVIDHRNSELSYACAGSRFLIYESKSFTMYKGDTKHIGDKPITGFKCYITHVTKLYPSSTLFLFTDGFQDQFGGTKDKKYSFRRMLELFEANIRLPLNEQEKMIGQEFEAWRAGEVQTDDITIVSVRGPSEPFVQRYSE